MGRALDRGLEEIVQGRARHGQLPGDLRHREALTGLLADQSQGVGNVGILYRQQIG